MLLISTLTPFTHCASCLQGQYNTPSGICATCPAPEQYSTGGLTTTCSACAPGSKVSGTSCTACTAGTFSSFKGSTACQACPPGTGSIANSLSCTRCDTSAKQSNGITALPACTSACTACVAGRYNDGATKKCSSCAAGKFSPVTQAISSSTCTPCPAGLTTMPTTTGASACIGCSTTNTLNPLSANYASNIDPLICAWNCNPGYTRFNFSETAYTPATYTSIGYSSIQSLQIFHNRNDFCCEPSNVNVGMYMCGTYPPACSSSQSCTRTSDGNAASCAPVANAHFVLGGSNKFYRCADWECNVFFFLNKTSNICTAQPTCSSGYTYQRHSITGDYVSQPSGSFTCVPCSRCIDGSETATPCTQINDTMCKLCSPTEFSYQAGKCVQAIPFGFNPVRIRLSAVPVFQGRPATYFDLSATISWSNIDFTQGFFLNSYTPCQPVSSTALMFIGGDETCNRMDISPQSLCALPLCKTQCRPWNGVEGWYKLKTGECSSCIYDTTCTKLQYSDMTTCGPVTAPRCINCPTIPLPNSLGWVNPYRTPFPGPYPCNIICRDGFTQSSNYTCIPCPMLPLNSKVTSGCNWTCSLGFVQDRVACIPCVGVPTSCSIGYYIGYAAATSQCAKCLPCTNLVENSIYTSQGLPNGPNTCGTRCVQNTFVSPGYGFDASNNPVACDRCGTPACEAGSTFLRPCSYLSDAECVSCSQCAVGSQVLSDCTASTNTTCVSCDSSLLPSNSSWAESGCVKWACNQGFVLNPNTSTCLKCKLPLDCIASNSYEDDGSGCGRCVACDLFLLMPGQCFNGDGQCGVSYMCDMPGMVTAAAFPTLYTTSVAAASVALSSSSNDTAVIAAASADNPPESNQIIAYALVATLTIDAHPDQLTAPFIADLDSQVSADCACEATIVAVTTQDNITTFCTPTSCVPLNQHRRLLLASQTSPLTVEIALVSNNMLTHPPKQPTCKNHAIIGWHAYRCQPIHDPTFVWDRRRLAVYFKRTGTPWVMEPTATSWEQYYLVVGIIVLVSALLLMGGGGAVYYVRVYNVQEVGVKHRATGYMPQGRFKSSEREMLLPGNWNKEW